MLTLLGIILKIVGIAIAVPNCAKQLRHWKDRERSKLYEYEFLFNRTGKKPTISRYKRIIYRMTRMPLNHLWK